MASEVMLKNETLEKHPNSSITLHVCTGNCIKWAKPLLTCLCFIHQVELCPADFNLLFTFLKARAASKYLQKNNCPFLFFISMRPFLLPYTTVPFEKSLSERNRGVSVPHCGAAALAEIPRFGGESWFLSSCLSGGLRR